MHSNYPIEPLNQCRVTPNPPDGRGCAPQKARGRSRSHFFNSLLVVYGVGFQSRAICCALTSCAEVSLLAM